MVRTIPKKLDGGRTALYRGKDAYASQTFENDSRAQKLTALLVAYLTNTQTLPASTDTEIKFITTQNIFINSPILRQIQRVLNSTSRFAIQKDFTAKITYHSEVLAYGTNAILDTKINILRNDKTIILHDRVSNTGSSSAAMSIGSSWILDLKQKDIIFMVVNPNRNITTLNGESNLSGNTYTLDGTRLIIEEIE